MKRTFRFPWDPPIPRNPYVPVRRDYLPECYRWSWRNGSEWFWFMLVGVITFALWFVSRL